MRPRCRSHPRISYWSAPVLRKFRQTYRYELRMVNRWRRSGASCWVPLVKRLAMLYLASARCSHRRGYLTRTRFMRRRELAKHVCATVSCQRNYHSVTTHVSTTPRFDVWIRR
jgi:hypothetical protein